MTTKPNLTVERCDEGITVADGRIIWNSAPALLDSELMATPDEAELFAYRLLAAVKRAREE